MLALEAKVCHGLVSPMFPVQSVTYVPGLYPPAA
jgi:hypothetical protein